MNALMRFKSQKGGFYDESTAQTNLAAAVSVTTNVNPRPHATRWKHVRVNRSPFRTPTVLVIGQTYLAGGGRADEVGQQKIRHKGEGCEVAKQRLQRTVKWREQQTGSREKRRRHQAVSAEDDGRKEVNACECAPLPRTDHYRTNSQFFPNVWHCFTSAHAEYLQSASPYRG